MGYISINISKKMKLSNFSNHNIFEWKICLKEATVEKEDFESG